MRIFLLITLLVASLQAFALQAKCYTDSGVLVYSGKVRDVTYNDDFFMFKNKRGHSMYIFGDCVFEG